MAEVGEALSHTVVCKGESKLPGRLGTPDYAVHKEGLLTGYVELKAPGKGLDIGGEGRGTRQDENVFIIQTPLAIAVAARFGGRQPGRPASVHYHRIGAATRDRKLEILDETEAFSDLRWENCPDQWQAPFRPAGKGTYFQWPLPTDLFPWQHSGCQFKRTCSTP